MDMQSTLPILIFALVTSATPGPNNLMLLASGAQFGFKRTIPHILGIAFGMAGLLLVNLMGLGQLFMEFPTAKIALKIVGISYLLWLAWKIMSAPMQSKNAPHAAVHNAKPLFWWQAAAFQFVNPKAWMMAVGAVSSFTSAGSYYWLSGMVLIGLFCIVNLPSISMWAAFGMVIQHLLSNAKRHYFFNIFMGLLTITTVFMMMTD